MNRMTRIGVLATALVVILSTGIAMGVAPGQDDRSAAQLDQLQDDEAPEEVTADEVRIENTTIEELTVTATGDEATVTVAGPVGDLDITGENATVIELLHVTEPAGDSYEVTNLSAPESVTVGDVVTVTADVTNPNEFTTTQHVAYRLDGDVEEREYRTLEGEETVTVTFELDTDELELEPDTYVHEVQTFDHGEVAILTVEPEEEEEEPRTGSLTVSDQTGDGTTLVVDEATANVDFTIVAEYDDERVETDAFDADEEVEEFEVALEPPIEENTTVDVSVHDVEEDETLATETIEYTVERPTATVTFEDQITDGTELTIASVNTSDGGFVAIHEDEGTTDDVIGVTAFLTPGEHENVTVPLFIDVPVVDFEQDALEEDATLLAMVHLDTTDDETFDFVASDGDDDGPYLDDEGEPVADEADVTLRAAELTVNDQTGDGTTLVVDEATANVDFTIVTEYEDERVETDAFDSDEEIENLTVDLEPPIEENTTVDVSVTDASDGDVLANETIEYTVDEEPLPEDEEPIPEEEEPLPEDEEPIPEEEEPLPEDEEPIPEEEEPLPEDEEPIPEEEEPLPEDEEPIPDEEEPLPEEEEPIGT